ncbi:MAG: [FeFe] hydrogenase H-cluster radical SAM maturase HydG [Firmicutes bacterium]|nr:[FeFe] hydrogenase H-cluster radical SAM maturase HydG [Bacillota bacterium]
MVDYDRETSFIDDDLIRRLLAQGPPSASTLADLLAKAEAARGLEPDELALLLKVDDEETWQEIFYAARKVKERIYGRRIVLFAPLYLSNYCINGCRYCGYRTGSGVVRKRLTMEEIREEVVALERMGHKRLAIETGEDPVNCPLDYVLEAIDTIYSVSAEQGAIRRLNVNIAATTVENYRRLKEHGIGTYILFQETYHRPTYAVMHPSGPKSDYAWHLLAFDRAMEAGQDDVGAGILFGLADYRYELLGLLLHARHLEERFGVGPHTVSVPRLKPAHGVDLGHFPHLVDDKTFKRIVALIRLALPYTGIIISTRESPALRRELLELGVSQISAASCTGVGGYSKRRGGPAEETAQFQIEDHRSLDEVLAALCRDGYLPSFCTACYRQGRTGDRFMALAKTGRIGEICTPNAILTFAEYLLDYGSEETKRLGRAAIEVNLAELPAGLQEGVRRRLARIAQGERDLYY